MTQRLPLMLAALLMAATTASAETGDTDAFTCEAAPAPVVRLDHGSRYAAEDDSRSEFDEASNDEVNKQLKPVDDFINDLAVAANTAVSSPDERSLASDCVLAGLQSWAEAGALSELATMNAQLSVPSRVAGLAFAYAQVRPFLSASDDTEQVEGWLAERARATMAYFDTDAPKNASRNNLRAWAGLAVARVGLTLDDPAMIDWADASVRLVACQAAPDGSLPLEMARRDLALHYQLHAVTPLVVTAALLRDAKPDLFDACDGAIHRTVDFVVAAFDDPGLVERIAGHEQSYFDGSEKLRAFELAWAEAYLSLFDDEDLRAFVEGYGDLGNSKLGGKQSVLWGI
ncbi:alginate lyase family protein [Tabrizicola sp. BL-A-41-H6]|uniref:alginate lyase family protein n=1 Tax=Tabrizicola sp. BL-A-41-H6 TaxID=3421107 RepID=UPI003D676E9D